MFKNQASQKIALFAFTTATGAPKTGDAANLTAYLSKDYGAVTALTDTSATEMDATNAPGWYLFDVSQTESNGDELLFTGKSATSGVTVVGRPVTTVPIRFTTMVIDAAGLVDANTVKLGPTGSGTAQTARDIGASVLLSAGTGTGQLDFTSGVVKANVTQWLGTTVSTPTVAGVPNVNCKTWNDLATVALPLVPTTAGRTLDVSATGEAGIDWANIGSPTTAVALTGTTIATTQKVDVETIKTNPVVNAGTVTFPTGATLASTTNITAGTITTATNVTTVNGLAANVITAASIAADAIGASELAADAVSEIQSGLATSATLALVKAVTDKLDTTLQLASGSPGDYEFSADALRRTPTGSAPSAAAIADAVWDEPIAGHLTSGTTGASLNAAGSAGDPWSTVLPGAYGAGTAGYMVGNTIKAQADRFLSMVEVASGSPGDYKFTPDALRAIISVVPTAIENADALLDRDMSAVSDTNARSPLNALRFLRNKWSISGATLTVYGENDSTAKWTATVATSAGADPVVGNDPA